MNAQARPTRLFLTRIISAGLPNIDKTNFGKPREFASRVSGLTVFGFLFRLSPPLFSLLLSALLSPLFRPCFRCCRFEIRARERSARIPEHPKIRCPFPDKQEKNRGDILEIQSDGGFFMRDRAINRCLFCPVRRNGTRRAREHPAPMHERPLSQDAAVFHSARICGPRTDINTANARSIERESNVRNKDGTNVLRTGGCF